MSGSLKAALAAVVVIVLAVAGSYAYFTLTGTPLPWEPAQTPTRVMLIAASPDDAQAVVAQVIAIVDTQTDTVTAVAPDTPATIAGTAYTELKDAFPFGGGAAVAQAYADLGAEAPAGDSAHSGASGDGSPLPFIVLPADEVTGTIDAMGGVSVAVPVQTDVFDGDVLYTFTPGMRMLSGPEFAALVKARPYLTPAERVELDDALAPALARIVAQHPEGLAGAVKNGRLLTDIQTEALTLLENDLRNLTY